MSEHVPPFAIVIPARYGSTRLPGKPLRLIAGKPMIVHVVERALAAHPALVVVATDDRRIADALHGGAATICMTRSDHVSGSDRLAECVEQLGWPDDTIVVNLQGDEPLAPASGIRAVVHALAAGDAPMATLATPVLDAAELFNPNCVKVVCDRLGYALYFSRAPIPWARETFANSRESLPVQTVFRRHIGIYAYRAGFLRRFSMMSATPLECAESLEQLRALEHGARIAVGDALEPFPAGVDTEADLARVEAVLMPG
jgi:3-deoxy-manno-octulosonate cytidylyltransferase (CMP-KDO synthetase)